MGLRQRLHRVERAIPEPEPRVRYRVLCDNGDGTGTDTATGEIVALGDGPDVLRLTWGDDGIDDGNDCEEVRDGN